jgi:hypothetical protein
MTLSSATIATAIAALSVSGVTIKDVDEIPESILPRACPIMFPSPDNWLGGANGEPADGPTTFGTASTRYWIINRAYRYVYLHEAVGATRGLKDVISAMATKADSIIEALFEMDITDVDVQNVTTGEFGVLEDPAGHGFFGFTVTITLRERINA